MQSRSGEKLLSIRTEEVEEGSGLPVIITNLTIFSDLTFKAHSRGVLVPNKKTADITAHRSKLSTVTETLNILARLNSLGYLLRTKQWRQPVCWTVWQGISIRTVMSCQ